MRTPSIQTLKRYAGTLGASLASGGLGYALLVFAPQTTDTSVWAWLGIGYLSLMVAAVAYARYEPDPDVRIVEVVDAIRRSPPAADGTPADDVVTAIEEADESDTTHGLCLKLNTPGGEIVPSDDIRRAVDAFDGPTVAYAQDLCASGGYLAACACDHIVARPNAHLGSIGVIGSQLNLSDFASEHGIDYERFAAGEYKDAGHPYKQVEEDERDYIQSLIDAHYDMFVRAVSDGRDLDADEVRATEARIYLGEDALDAGLVDELGDEETATDWLESELEAPEATTEQVSPGSDGLFNLVGAAERIAHAFGAGVASNLQPETIDPALDVLRRR